MAVKFEIMKTEPTIAGPLHSQEPPTCPCHEPDQSSQCPPPHSSKIYFNFPGFSKWSPSLRSPHQDPVRTSPLRHMCYMPHSSHSSWFDDPNIWEIQIIKCLIISSFSIPRYLVPHWPKYLPYHPIPENPRPISLTHCGRTSFTPIQNNRQNYSSIYLELYICGQQTGRQKILHQIIAIP